MSKIILLDSRPLGLITNPRQNVEAESCKDWMQNLLAEGNRVLVPEIIDYEVRRELLRAAKWTGLAALDETKLRIGFLPLTTSAMQQAAAFWALARNTRRQTADNLALDTDMILAAQAATLDPAQWGLSGADVVIAPSNVGHLNRFANAQEWQDIS